MAQQVTTNGNNNLLDAMLASNASYTDNSATTNFDKIFNSSIEKQNAVSLSADNSKTNQFNKISNNKAENSKNNISTTDSVSDVNVISAQDSSNVAENKLNQTSNDKIATETSTNDVKSQINSESNITNENSQSVSVADDIDDVVSDSADSLLADVIDIISKYTYVKEEIIEKNDTSTNDETLTSVIDDIEIDTDFDIDFDTLDVESLNSSKDNVSTEVGTVQIEANDDIEIDADIDYQPKNKELISQKIVNELNVKLEEVNSSKTENVKQYMTSSVEQIVKDVVEKNSVVDTSKENASLKEVEIISEEDIVVEDDVEIADDMTNDTSSEDNTESNQNGKNLNIVDDNKKISASKSDANKNVKEIYSDKINNRSDINQTAKNNPSNNVSTMTSSVSELKSQEQEISADEIQLQDDNTDTKEKMTKKDVNVPNGGNKNSELNVETGKNVSDSKINVQIGTTVTGRTSVVENVQSAELRTSASTMNDSVSISKEDIIAQIHSKLQSMNSNNSKLTMILNPESLGKVTVQLVNTKDGMTAEMVVQSQMVKEMLDENISNLKETLTAQGVSVNNISVKVSESENNAEMDYTEQENSDSNKQEQQNQKQEKEENKFEEMFFNSLDEEEQENN